MTNLRIDQVDRTAKVDVDKVQFTRLIEQLGAAR